MKGAQPDSQYGPPPMPQSFKISANPTAQKEPALELEIVQERNDSENRSVQSTPMIKQEGSSGLVPLKRRSFAQEDFNQLGEFGGGGSPMVTNFMSNHDKDQTRSPKLKPEFKVSQANQPAKVSSPVIAGQVPGNRQELQAPKSYLEFAYCRPDDMTSEEFTNNWMSPQTIEGLTRKKNVKNDDDTRRQGAQ